jgi:hypothetical protein
MELAGTHDNLSKQYSCDNCNYTTSRINDFNKHIKTIRHQLRSQLAETLINSQKLATTVETCDFKCMCGINYKSRSGLWKHKKLCTQVEPIYATNEQKQQFLSDKIFLELIKQNQEFKELMIEQNKKHEELTLEQNKKNEDLIFKIFELTKDSKCITNYNTLNNNTNSNNTNNTFNLQVFLNETCKNAMNLTDFVNSLNVTIADLEETGRLGFSDGITKIIVKGLKDLDITERPIHCTDVKRETIYVKEEDVWQKDDNHDKLTKAIKQVSQKNTKNIMEWQRINPEYSDSNSKQSSRFNKLLLNVMSGGTIEEQQGNFTKVVKNITREVVIQKNTMIVL